MMPKKPNVVLKHSKLSINNTQTVAIMTKTKDSNKHLCKCKCSNYVLHKRVKMLTLWGINISHNSKYLYDLLQSKQMIMVIMDLIRIKILKTKIDISYLKAFSKMKVKSVNCRKHSTRKEMSSYLTYLKVVIVLRSTKFLNKRRSKTLLRQ